MKLLKTALQSLLLLLPISTFAQHKIEDNRFSFVTSSCAYINRSLEDSAGIKYNNDTSIFYRISKSNADFMVWLGDNWYLDEMETKTKEGLWNKASSQRNSPLLKRISNAMPEFAIWDDHDYGPNNSDKNFLLKEESRTIFLEAWKNNPSFGENNQGIYTSFHYKNTLFILLDDRWWRSNDDEKAYISSGLFFQKRQINKTKKMFGDPQMEWLKSILKSDYSDFKIIVNGSQVLNPLAKGDCLIHFPKEYNELLNFIADEKINGVLFLSGDRHFSDIISVQPDNQKYPLYDITVSSLTATSDKPRGKERRNPNRVKNSLVLDHNFAQFYFEKTDNNNLLTVKFFDTKGKMLNQWSINSKNLINP